MGAYGLGKGVISVVLLLLLLFSGKQCREMATYNTLWPDDVVC